jgi:hypothetical protein
MKSEFVGILIEILHKYGSIYLLFMLICYLTIQIETFQLKCESLDTSTKISFRVSVSCLLQTVK